MTTMKMDDPKTWQKRVDALYEILEETMQLADEIVENRATKVEEVLGEYAEDDRVADLIQFLRETTPGKRKTGGKNSHISEALNHLTEREFYLILYETNQIVLAQDLVAELNAYAHEVFDFFSEGYYSTKPENRFPASKVFKPMFVMRTLINQASFDLNIYQRAINQRRRINYGDEYYFYLTLQGYALYLADHVATLAMIPAMKAGYLSQDTKILTYLDKNIRARLLPYSNSVLISIAFATMQFDGYPTQDYLALPHEIGHYLYWHGMMPGTDTPVLDELFSRIRAAKIKAKDWRLQWLEEIFADTYALLVGGPVIVLDFQDMLDDDVQSHFTEDTDKHPIPELRPLIQTQILRQIKSNLGKPLYTRTPDRLDANWEDWLRKQWGTEDVLDTTFSLRGGKKLTGTNIIQALEPLIELVLDVLSSARPLDPKIKEDSPFCEHAWSTDLKKNSSLTQLYKMFSARAWPQDEFLENIVTDESLEREKPLPPYGRTLERLTEKQTNELTMEDLVELILFRGWSDQGPLGGSGKTDEPPPGGGT
jgi:hypothetical protein